MFIKYNFSVRESQPLLLFRVGLLQCHQCLRFLYLERVSMQSAIRFYQFCSSVCSSSAGTVYG